MNTQHNKPLNTLTSAETTQLTAIVPETLAVGLDSHKPFTAAELWNIQR